MFVDPASTCEVWHGKQPTTCRIALQVYRARVRQTGEEVAVKLVDLEKLGASMVSSCAAHACCRGSPPAAQHSSSRAMHHVALLQARRHSALIAS